MNGRDSDDAQQSDDWFSGPTESPAPADRPGLALVDAAETESESDDWFQAPDEDTPVSPDEDPASTRQSPAQLRHLRKPTLLAAGAIVALLALLVGGGVFVSTSLPTSEPVSLDLAPATTPASSISATPATDTGAPTPWCARLADGEPISMTSPDHGTAAIAAFQDAYFAARDAAAARRHVHPTARVGSVEELSAGITTVAPGTVHCVLANKVDAGLYAVDLFARRPDGVVDHYRQTVTTTDDPAAPHQAVITGITDRDTK